MAFDRAQDMAKVLGIGPISCLDIVEAKRFARLLHEVHQLMHLQQGDEGIEQAAEILVHQHHEGGAAGRHPWNPAGGGHILGRRRAGGLEDRHVHVGKRELAQARRTITIGERAERCDINQRSINVGAGNASVTHGGLQVRQLPDSRPGATAPNEDARSLMEALSKVRVSAARRAWPR